MKIPCPHFDIEIVSRGKGRSVIAAAAYQSGETLFSQYTGTWESGDHEERIVHKEDRMMGRISEENFSMLMAKTQTEQEETKARIRLLEQEQQYRSQSALDDEQWREAIRQYADITELDAVTLNKLVRQVVVHEEIGEDESRKITVEIHFNMRQPILTA